MVNVDHLTTHVHKCITSIIALLILLPAGMDYITSLFWHVACSLNYRAVPTLHFAPPRPSTTLCCSHYMHTKSSGRSGGLVKSHRAKSFNLKAGSHLDARPHVGSRSLALRCDATHSPVSASSHYARSERTPTRARV